MKNSNALKQFAFSALTLVFLLGFVTAFMFEMESQKPIPSTISVPATNASAEQDARMVMQELERERVDQLNTNSFIEQSRARAAARDLRMVMQELERERLDQLNANSIDEQSRIRIAAQDKQMVMQELEREQLD